VSLFYQIPPECRYGSRLSIEEHDWQCCLLLRLVLSLYSPSLQTIWFGDVYIQWGMDRERDGWLYMIRYSFVAVPKR